MTSTDLPPADGAGPGADYREAMARLVDDDASGARTGAYRAAMRERIADVLDAGDGRPSPDASERTVSIALGHGTDR